MDSEIDGREVWIVTIGEGAVWQLAGVYSSERRAEAAIAHLRDSDASLPATAMMVRVDEELRATQQTDWPSGHDGGRDAAERGPDHLPAWRDHDR